MRRLLTEHLGPTLGLAVTLFLVFLVICELYTFAPGRAVVWSLDRLWPNARRPVRYRSRHLRRRRTSDLHAADFITRGMRLERATRDRASRAQLALTAA